MCDCRIGNTKEFNNIVVLIALNPAKKRMVNYAHIEHQVEIIENRLPVSAYELFICRRVRCGEDRLLGRGRDLN